MGVESPSADGMAQLKQLRLGQEQLHRRLHAQHGSVQRHILAMQQQSQPEQHPLLDALGGAATNSAIEEILQAMLFDHDAVPGVD